jgi:hypothetical protein
VADVKPVLDGAAVGQKLARHDTRLALQEGGARAGLAACKAAKQRCHEGVNSGVVQVVHRRGVHHAREHVTDDKLKL